MENVEIIERKRELTKKEEIILYFFIYAAIGWILEMIYCVYELGVIQNRGFLIGPICPIYGIGAVSILLITQRKKLNNIKIFILALVLFTVLEYITSLTLEWIFHIRWWDYSNEWLNFQGRISLFYSIAWGIFAVIFVKWIHPNIEKLVKIVQRHITYYAQLTIIYGACILLVIDFVLSILNYI